MLDTALISPEPIERSEPEPLSAAIAGVRRRLFRRNDTDQVIADFVEDDLREGVRAFSEVESFLVDLLEALAGDAPSIDLIAAADDAAAQQQLEYLAGLFASLRRRVGYIAARPAAEGRRPPFTSR
jgi:hypothetical protein